MSKGVYLKAGLVPLLIVAGNAHARFVSVDPVQANPNNGTNFNRYYYANNNPYKFTDPDGRVAIITHQRDGSVTIQVPMKFSGPQATAENISSIKSQAAEAFSGTHQINGNSTQVNFQVVDITSSTPAAAHNEVQLISGTTSHPTGRSFVNAVGGTSGEINMSSSGIAHGEASHEMGHFAGAQDQYSYTTGQVNAAYAGNLMGQLPGTVDSRNIGEMLTNSNNIIRHEQPPQPEKFIGPR